MDLSEANWNAFQDRCRSLSGKFFIDVLSSPYLDYKLDWETRLDNPTFFRVCNPVDGALETSGSLAKGARLNVGGPQSHAFSERDFGSLARMQGAVYVGDSAATAIIETYGDEYDFGMLRAKVRADKNKQLYRIELIDPSQPIFLIEYEAVYQALAGVYALNGFFDVTKDMNGRWGNLHHPAPIQLFGAWLMQEGQKHDHPPLGIRFKSTQEGASYNTVLYFRNRAAAERLFKATPIDP